MEFPGITKTQFLPFFLMKAYSMKFQEKIERVKKMQGIGFGFKANENSRKRTRIDCESDCDENFQETQIIDNPADRILGAGHAGTIPRFVAPDGNLEANLKKSRAKRSTKELQEIYGRKGEGPINYKKIFKGLMIGPTLSLMDLMQISPDFTRHLIKLSIQFNRRKKKLENANSGVNAAATFRPVRRKPYTSTAGLVLGMGVAYDDKAFRFPAELLIYDNEHPKGVKIELEAQHVMADQGSDTNVIANWLVKN
ncbi:hypothetical protein GcM3_141013 [Golovinomyces cichoracearum]|uniref:Uncharacterized protein n=1 Tax=Golovinomyces cichoracearum TaxID=62708 RepID=A0A420I0B2_9PEZI|nr:hypothetical protein GcM3_141013 [Golovinomyces cichoracearum]